MNKRKNKPMQDSELDRLDDILNGFHNEQAMNLEALDGFFAALHCTPSIVPPSRYLPELWGGNEMADDDAFENEAAFQEFINLVTAFWNDAGRRFDQEDVFLPVLLENPETGIAHGNDWATGFMRGIEYDRDDWQVLMEDEEEGGWIIPIMTLAHEHDPDPDMRPYSEPVSPERREQLLIYLAAGATRIYKYFRPLRIYNADAQRMQSTVKREQPKVGRNDPCPCGSGSKYKKCCGKTASH